MFDFDMNLNKCDINSNMDLGEAPNKDQIFFELADFSYESDGSINVAYTNTDPRSPIYIYKVKKKL